MHVEIHVVRSKDRTTVAETTDQVNAGSDRKVSEYTVCGVWTSHGAQADPSPPRWAREYQNWTSEQWRKLAWSDEFSKFKVLTWPQDISPIKPLCVMMCRTNKSNHSRPHVRYYRT